MTDAPTPAQSLAAAELRARQARGRVLGTIGQLQARLDPRVRAQKVAREVRVVGETAAAIARDKPAATGGAIAGVALLAGALLGRHRIGRLFSRSRTDTSPSTAGLAPVTRTEP